MRNLQLAAKECMEQLDSIGVPYGKIDKFEVNTRAKRRWGQCKRNGFNGHCTINISASLLDENVPIKSLYTTIIHELLHSCDGGNGHTGAWRKWASIVNYKLGYEITRTSSSESKGVSEDVTVSQAKHKFVCEKCGKEILRMRESKFTKNYENYRCLCGGRLKKIF